MELWKHVIIALAYFGFATAKYDGATCCQLAKDRKQFVGEYPENPDDQVCGQAYSTAVKDKPAAPLYVSYEFCSTNCNGIDVHHYQETEKWMAPIVQFILPSVIFSMTIPRQKKLEFSYPFHKPESSSWKRVVFSLLALLLYLIPILVDTVVWISWIVAGAGNMVVSGMLEALIDYRIIHYVESLTANDPETLAIKRELLVAIASGNLKLGEGNPQKEIPDALIVPNNSSADRNELSRSRLLNLMGAQSSFGGAVGSPVVFYLGAFAFTILELYNDPSSQAYSISLGFGIEWMIIVHVAIVSGCLLAANNPSTSSGIVGSQHMSLIHRVVPEPRLPSPVQASRQMHAVSSNRSGRGLKALLKSGWSNSYETKYQPVSLWARGTNKMRWVEQSIAWNVTENSTPAAIHQDGNTRDSIVEDNSAQVIITQDTPNQAQTDQSAPKKSFQESMHIGFWSWVFKVWAASILLIVIPPVAGGAIAYATPPRGIACRSLSFIIYASSQVALVTLATIRVAVDKGRIPSQQSRKEIWFTSKSYKVVCSIFWFTGFCSAVGGTFMQIIGIFNNCICYAGAKNWYALWRINPEVNLASDTQDSRNASEYWQKMGLVAAIFMMANTYLGWWYQRMVRHRFQRAVMAMYVDPAETNGAGVGGRGGSIPPGGNNTMLSPGHARVPSTSDDEGRESSDSHGDHVPLLPHVGSFGPPFTDPFTTSTQNIELKNKPKHKIARKEVSPSVLEETDLGAQAGPSGYRRGRSSNA